MSYRFWMSSESVGRTTGARTKGPLAAAMALVLGVMTTPVVAAGPPDGLAAGSPSPSQSQSPTPTPSPTQSASPPAPDPTGPSDSTGVRPIKPGRPRPPSATRPADDVDKDAPNEPKKKRKKKPKKKPKKKRPPVVDMAVVFAQAEQQLATAEADLAGAQRELEAAREVLGRATSELGRLKKSEALSAVASPATAAESGLRGLGVGLIPLSQPLTDADETGVAAGTSTGKWSSAARRGVGAAPRVAMAQAEADRGLAQQRVAAAEAALNLVRLNIETAKAILGLADGRTTAEAAAKKFSDYPVGECDFPDVANPNDCREAQRWAIAQTINPMKDWYYLCLNLVTIAYGWSSGHPTAISMWNALPESRKHSPNTVAPPGALMFWGPNHVALSLGNNVMVSTDVLGTGRAWIVDFATIQAVWGFPYLGWSEPDFSQ